MSINNKPIVTTDKPSVSIEHGHRGTKPTTPKPSITPPVKKEK